MKRSLSRPALLALAAALALAGCTSTVPSGQPATGETATAGATGAATSAAEPDALELTITDPWIKATDTEMTGAFGVLANNTASPVHVVAVSSSVSDRNELHEMVSQDGTMVMVEMEDGFVIEAGSEFVLEPGANHLMIMDLAAPIEAGENVELTLEFEDGGTFSWIAPARTFAGAQEEYVESEPSPSESATPVG